jgi:tRNA threonylcarbamoyladenosine biosynthesis protein TsaE
MNPVVTLRLPDLAATGRLAARLAALARRGDAVLLQGPLGAGKSAFARAFLRAASGDPGLEVPSPSFTLVQGYDLPGGLMAHHFDLYRLSGPAEIAELGWEEARDAGIVLVEWPERLGEAALPCPEEALTVALAHGAAEEERVAALSGWPDRLHRAVEAPAA